MSVGEIGTQVSSLRPGRRGSPLFHFESSATMCGVIDACLG